MKYTTFFNISNVILIKDQIKWQFYWEKMYRRIELINHFPAKDGSTHSYIHGLCGISHELVADAWFEMQGPRKPIKKNVRFYFTEKGWEMYGRKAVEACQKCNQEYRIIATEEHDVSVYYKDDIQVCIYPKKNGK